MPNHASWPVVGVIAVAVLTACGNLPGPPAPSTALIEPPPVMSINGVEGHPVSWCYEGCGDGIMTRPDLLPVISPPFDVELPEGATMDRVNAIGQGHPENRLVQPVGFGGSTIEDVPAGPIMLSVHVTWDGGGDASYYWALAFDEL